mmetsp:Transcript_6615/g.24557  ORF Transcript_6615/g.24557 Transcript_6615/m.24557 type:complete len:263 (-) Transcript_6615:1011-1799(-)
MWLLHDDAHPHAPEQCHARYGVCAEGKGDALTEHAHQRGCHHAAQIAQEAENGQERHCMGRRRREVCSQQGHHRPCEAVCEAQEGAAEVEVKLILGPADTRDAHRPHSEGRHAQALATETVHSAASEDEYGAVDNEGERGNGTQAGTVKAKVVYLQREEQLDCNPHQYEQCTDKACAQQSSPVRRQRLSQKEPRALLLLRLRSCQICIAATRLVEVAHVHAVDTFFLRRRNAWAVAEYTWHTDEGEDALQGEGGAKVGALGE